MGKFHGRMIASLIPPLIGLRGFNRQVSYQTKLYNSCFVHILRQKKSYIDARFLALVFNLLYSRLNASGSLSCPVLSSLLYLNPVEMDYAKAAE